MAERRSAARRRRKPRRNVRFWLLGAGVVVGIVALLVVSQRRPGGESVESAGVLEAGRPAPAVALPSTDGTRFDLSDFRGRQSVLLYFYEHAG